MTVRDQLLNNTNLAFAGNIFYQKDISPKFQQFEHCYTGLRASEGRIYADEIAMGLPRLPINHPLEKEWQMRRVSSEWLIEYLKTKAELTVLLEVGCGNGWQSAALCNQLNVDVCALDVNEQELIQAARLYGARQKMHFIYADILQVNFGKLLFDIILLSASVQYFDDLETLVAKLMEKLTPDGEIHIIDSPIYSNPKQARLARERSRTHFESVDWPEMEGHYNHHQFVALSKLKYAIQFDPKTIASKLRRKILKRVLPHFPWVIIKHG